GLWDGLRMRGLDRRAAPTVREASDRAALMMLAADAAGVRTPQLRTVAEAHDSVLMLTEHVEHARRLDDLAPEEIHDGVLDQLWTQLRAAHRKGLAHRDLHAASVLVDGHEAVWILDWENGEVASSELARRVDMAQALAMTAVLVGVERALASAARTLTADQLSSIAPLLQPIALPAATRAAARNHRELLSTLRSELVGLIPTADVEPVRLARFSARTAVMVILLVAALWVLLGTLNFADIAEAVQQANPWWMLVAFALGLVTYLGSAMGLVAFSPERLGLWRTTQVQIAASVVALVAPAGVGPAALNLRFLNRRRVPMPLAVATVALLQVMQFVTTVALLLVVALVTGSMGSLSLPSTAVLAAVGGVILAVALALLVPPVREWLWSRLAPTLRQVWPRLVWVAGNPGRLALGISGSVLMAAGYIAAFGASLAAFGYTLPLTSLAITYLGASATGSAVPSPGGVGPVELALTAGLTLAGIPYGAAFSTAILFRLLTFWGRVPLGWAALRYLQHHDDL
ncbi:flippase-like domain-containing protein, partial [Georgenia sp. 10Sc9-8]|nr:flippase-like domain-containing protein [Georgenia halotolerans]